MGVSTTPVSEWQGVYFTITLYTPEGYMQNLTEKTKLNSEEMHYSMCKWIINVYWKQNDQRSFPPDPKRPFS